MSDTDSRHQLYRVRARFIKLQKLDKKSQIRKDKYGASQQGDSWKNSVTDIQ